MGGRSTLINSVLDNIPTYIMSMLPIPSKVQIDKIRSSFLWRGSYEGHKFHLVKWENVIMPKQHGGLGIRDYEMMVEICSRTNKYLERVAQNTEDGVRVPCFRRNFQDWELNELLDFFRTLEGASMSPHLPDSLKWGSSETVAAALWNMFISIAGINWILSQSVKEAVGSWSLREVDSHIKKTWQMILSCFFGAFGRKGISDVLMVSQPQLAV
ncbi:hypothetical protein MTR67_033766 [Solanum verrucosum]|uniref:Uncharacterized protein n=1 Tax=Solanum verrucosum TaxID=315347 RepID=A0AAF0ZHV6_SOLVR|nr:hypothetical protein MTR67_033766 [Solanum verrucosum]